MRRKNKYAHSKEWIKLKRETDRKEKHIREAYREIYTDYEEALQKTNN